MSKRHQASRRKTYGRRQHEVRERTERRHAPEPTEFGDDEFATTPSADGFSYADPRTSRLRFGYSD